MAGASKRGLSASKTRSTGMKGGKKSGAVPKSTAVRGKPGPKLPGEKSVKETQRTVDVKPLKLTRAAKTPMDPNAIDHRKQVFDDQKGGR